MFTVCSDNFLCWQKSLPLLSHPPKPDIKLPRQECQIWANPVVQTVMQDSPWKCKECQKLVSTVMQDSVCLSLVAGYPAKRKYKAVRGRMPNRGLASGKSCHRHSQGRMGQAACSWFKCQDAAMGKLSKCGSTGWNLTLLVLIAEDAGADDKE